MGAKLGSASCEVPILAPERKASPQERLIRECIGGDESAWHALLDQYKGLILSIPIKYGFSREEAADIYQAVCVEILAALPHLRDPGALPKWISQVTAHKCFHHQRQLQRLELMDPGSAAFEQILAPASDIPAGQAEEEEKLHQALSELRPRCQKLIRMLFLEDPPRPYQQVAQTLGVAIGSIGFMRQRCLRCLRKKLVEKGLQ